MKRMNYKVLTAAVAVALLMAGSFLQVFASPSIAGLQGESESAVAEDSADGTNAAAVLSRTDVYTDRANSEEYMTADEEGELQETPLSRAIGMAASAVTGTDENGAPMVDNIPTVADIVRALKQDEADEQGEGETFDLDSLDQLTYFRDFKYAVSGKKVTAGDQLVVDGQAIVLENGQIQVSISGDEVMRSGQKEAFRIIQCDPVKKTYYVLEMKEYDETTGDFIVDFPCVGPYMVTQIMNREVQ